MASSRMQIEDNVGNIFLPTPAFLTKTAAQWTADTRVLQPGEPAVESDTGLMKVGDGTKRYSQLNYTKQGNVWGACVSNDVVVSTEVYDLALDIAYPNLNVVTDFAQLEGGNCKILKSGYYMAITTLVVTDTTANKGFEVKANAGGASSLGEFAFGSAMQVRASSAVGSCVGIAYLPVGSVVSARISRAADGPLYRIWGGRWNSLRVYPLHTVGL